MAFTTRCDTFIIFKMGYDFGVSTMYSFSIFWREIFCSKKKDGRQQKGVEFFMQFVNADCPKIAIENPVGIMSTLYRKPDQIIQPWMFGHAEQKATCLWLKNLPKLTPTKIVTSHWNRLYYLSPSPDRAKIRSKTYSGIAKAMAEQWG